MRIGCDLDNVIVDTMAGAKSALARDHDLDENEIIETLIYWQPYSHSEASIAQKLVTPLEFWDREDVLLGAPPVSGSLEAAWRMHDAGILACYITRRPPHVAELTKRWLTENGFPDLPVEHVGNRNADQYFAICKSTICQRYDVTHMIDDLADEAITLRNAGIEILLINAPIGRAARDAFLDDNPDVRVFDNALAAAEFALASPMMAAAGR
jgi:hypothetical protein